MQIILQDINKASLLKRIQAHEKNGYECACKITPKRTVVKNYSYNDNRINKYKPSGLSQATMYYVKMRKIT